MQILFLPLPHLNFLDLFFPTVRSHQVNLHHKALARLQRFLSVRASVNESQDCPITDAEDFSAPMFVQHTEVMLVDMAEPKRDSVDWPYISGCLFCSSRNKLKWRMWLKRRKRTQLKIHTAKPSCCRWIHWRFCTRFTGKLRFRVLLHLTTWRSKLISMRGWEAFLLTGWLR